MMRVGEKRTFSQAMVHESQEPTEVEAQEPEIVFTDDEEEIDNEEAERAFVRMMEASDANKQQKQAEIKVEEVAINQIIVDEIEKSASEDNTGYNELTQDEVKEETKGVSDNETDDTEKIEIAKPVKRKREKKAIEKENHMCTGCHNHFKQLVDKKLRLCYACVYIYTSVTQQVKKNKGTVSVVHNNQDKALFVITCMRGHVWEAAFVARQGHRWCKACPAIERKLKREAAQEALRIEHEKIKEQQRLMFERARQQMYFHEEVIIAEEPVIQTAEVLFIKDIVQRIIAGDFQVDTALQQPIVEFIMAASEELIKNIFVDAVPQDIRKRVLRRISLVVHPDKCGHALAKEAFQKFHNIGGYLLLNQESTDNTNKQFNSTSGEETD